VKKLIMLEIHQEKSEELLTFQRGTRVFGATRASSGARGFRATRDSWGIE